MCSLDLCLDLNYSHWIFQGFSLFSYQGTLLSDSLAATLIEYHRSLFMSTTFFNFFQSFLCSFLASKLRTLARCFVIIARGYPKVNNKISIFTKKFSHHKMLFLSTWDTPILSIPIVKFYNSVLLKNRFYNHRNRIVFI